MEKRKKAISYLPQSFKVLKGFKLDGETLDKGYWTKQLGDEYTNKGTKQSRNFSIEDFQYLEKHLHKEVWITYNPDDYNESVVVESFDTFINEMYMGPADGKGAFDDHQKKQLGYNKDAVSSDPDGFGNGGNAGAPVGAVGEDGPTMMSDRLGDIEPEGYPSAAGQRQEITPAGSQVVSHNNMRGEPKLTNIQK